MMTLLRISMLAAALLGGGCATATVDQPAKFASTLAPACIAEISAFAAKHTGRMVSLAATDFTQSDTLVLAQVAARDAQGRLLDGRMRAPVDEVLKLASRGQACVLTHLNSGAQTPLQACGLCVPYKP